MNRLRLPIVLLAALALAAGLVACGGDAGDRNPRTVLDDATLAGVESGVVDLSLKMDAEGREDGDLDLQLSGPFQGAGGDELPRLDLEIAADGKLGDRDVDFEGGLVLLSNSAYVSHEGTAYEVDPTTFSFLESAIRQGQREGDREQQPSACREAIAELRVADFVDDLTNEGGADVGGTETTKVSGELDAATAIDAVVGIARSPACRGQLGPAGGALLPEERIDEAKETVKDGVGEARIEVYVGDDDIIRRIVARLDVQPRARDGAGDGAPDAARTRIDLDLTLTDVNEEQEISAPQNAKPLNELFMKLNVNPIELLGLVQGEEGEEALGNLLEGLSGER